MAIGWVTVTLQGPGTLDAVFLLRRYLSALG